MRCSTVWIAPSLLGAFACSHSSTSDQSGDFVLSIRLGKTHICGSPFPIKVGAQTHINLIAGTSFCSFRSRDCRQGKRIGSLFGFAGKPLALIVQAEVDSAAVHMPPSLQQASSASYLECEIVTPSGSSFKAPIDQLYVDGGCGVYAAELLCTVTPPVPFRFRGQINIALATLFPCTGSFRPYFAAGGRQPQS